MNTVEPIRDNEVVRQIEEKLEALDSPRGKRMYLLLILGMYLGLRISDLVKLRVSDIRGRDVIAVREQKTGKASQLPIAGKLKRVCRQRLAGLPGDAFIFQSRQKDPDGNAKPISRKTAWNDIQDMAGLARLDYSLGCHSLRKTFGYHYYKQTGDIAFLMIWFNHSSADVTKRYIGIDLDERAKKIRGFEI
jgi:integrase